MGILVLFGVPHHSVLLAKKSTLTHHFANSGFYNSAKLPNLFGCVMLVQSVLANIAPCVLEDHIVLFMTE